MPMTEGYNPEQKKRPPGATGMFRPYFRDPDNITGELAESFMDGIKSLFPVVGKKYTLNLSNVHAALKSMTDEEEKEAILNSKSITIPVAGDVSLSDNITGKVISNEAGYPLGKTFVSSRRGTYVIKGNNYSIANQLVLKSGVYVREDNNGDLEAHFNTEKGQSFTLTMDPKTLLFYITPRGTQSKQLLFPLLLALLPAAQVKQGLGNDIFNANISMASGADEKTLRFLFKKLAPKEMQEGDKSISDIRELLPAVMDGIKIDPTTTIVTLGKEHSSVTGPVLLATVEKLVAVYKGEQNTDNRDSLAFKKVRRTPDFIKARFEKGEVSKRLKGKLEFRINDAKRLDVRAIMPPNYFTKVLTDFFQTSSLAFNPTETNPLENYENLGKVTTLGEGGIQDENAIPTTARALDTSHFGFLDIVRTPESGHAGVDLRFAHNVGIDNIGRMFTPTVSKTGVKRLTTPVYLTRRTIGMPGESKRGGKVLGIEKGQMKLVKPSEVDDTYKNARSFFGPMTFQIPFLNSDHPGRLIMAGKAIPQALSLKYREVPLVTPEIEDDLAAQIVNPYTKRAEGDGVVTKVTPDLITTTTEKIPLIHDLPLNQKGFLDYSPIVNVGDHVKAGQIVADSNYTKGGRLAIGKNLHVAYMPYKGYNFEDGIVISKTAAEKMTSNHMYVEKVELGKNVTTNLAFLKKYYREKFHPQQLAGLDSKGFPQVGRILHKGDPIYIFFEKREPSIEDKMLGRLNKLLLNPYSLITTCWEHDNPGKVVEVGSHAGSLRVAIREDSPLEVGDKLTGLHGNKGVVTKILPDELMPQLASGDKIDLLLNPAGVTSRVNLGQLLETAAGKVAHKTGKQIKVENFANQNNLEFVKGLMKRHGVADMETLIDPETGKPFESKIFTGRQYILKLNKTASAGYSARGEGPGYDLNGQPKKGGMDGAKKIGFMEWLGLLSSDARHNLKEMGTVKSERGSYWGNFVSGTALPLPPTTFATQKFLHSLTGAGVHVKENGTHWQATPLTDADILSASKGEIKNPGFLQAKNLEPERGGLFDPVLTGGIRGGGMNHFTLAEPMLNPVLETSVRKLLGLSGAQMEKLVSGEYYVKKTAQHGFGIFDGEGKLIKGVGHLEEEEIEEELEKESSEQPEYRGGDAFRKLLSFNVGKKKDAMLEEFRGAKTKNAKQEALSKLRVLHGFHNSGIKNPANAAILHYYPVVPPKERPILPKSDGSLEYADVNHLYRDAMLVNQGLRSLKGEVPDSDLQKERLSLYKGIKALQGYGEPISWSAKSRGIKGFAKGIAGTDPKHGYFQDKLLSKKQDFSGRLVLSENPELNLDEAEVPEEFIWSTYKTHLLKGLMQRGYTYLEAEKAIQQKTPAARDVMMSEVKRVPIIVNRNPTLLKSNLIALKPIPTNTKTLNINPLTFKGMNADVDGDQVNIYVPMTHKAVEEAKEKLTPNNNIMDFRRGAGGGAYTAPSHEAVLGAYYLTTPNTTKSVVKFKTEAEVLHALKEGHIDPDTPVEIGQGKK